MTLRIFSFIGLFAILFISCKKDKTSLQQKLDEGQDPLTLLEEYPADSFYSKSYQGGYITRIFQDGHGMVVSKSDVGSNVSWGCGGLEINAADGASLGTGKENTDSINAQCADAASAAAICLTYTAEGYSDWYLPSEKELYYAYSVVHQKGVGDFGTTNYYWTSTELTSTTAKHLLFTDGSVNSSTKSNSHLVRAVRDF